MTRGRVREVEEKSWAHTALRRGIAAIAASTLMFFLYILSFGPAFWLTNEGYLPDWMTVIYVPLGVFFELFPSLASAFEKYMELWEPG
jgi:hypothetical protein